MLLAFSFANAQIASDEKVPVGSLLSFNSLEKMQQPFSFKQQSIIARLMATQKKQMDEGVLSEFESRCISSNMVIMFGDDNAEKFVAIAEKAYGHEMSSLSQDDITFMTKINDKYMGVLSLVTTECSQKETKEEHE